MFEFFFLNAVTQTSAEKNGWPSTLTMVGQFFYLALVCTLMCVLAYYVTKWLARAKGTQSAGGNLKIVEAISVGNQSFVQLIKVGEKFFLIGVTKEKITFLSEVDNSDIVYEQYNKEFVKLPFEKYFKQVLRKDREIHRGESNED